MQPTLYSDGSVRKAYQLTIDLLKDEPNLKGIIGLNEPSTLGAGEAIMDMGFQDKVKLFGFDNSSNEVKLLEKGFCLARSCRSPLIWGI